MKINEPVIFDTSVVVAMLRREDDVVQAIVPYSQVHITVTVLGELYYGAYHSSKVSYHLAECALVEDKFPLHNHSQQTSRMYGEVKARLRTTGRVIPENDMWIAAVAIEHKSTLITRDRHFERVRGLSVVVL